MDVILKFIYLTFCAQLLKRTWCWAMDFATVHCIGRWWEWQCK